VDAGPAHRALERVQIAAHHQGRLAGPAELTGQRGEHVVRLEADSLEHRESERGQQRGQPGELAAERRRGGRAAGLVAGEGPVPEGGARVVHREGATPRALLAQELEQQPRQPVERARRLAARGAHVRQREERPVRQRQRVQEENRPICHRRRSPFWPSPAIASDANAICPRLR